MIRAFVFMFIGAGICYSYEHWTAKNVRQAHDKVDKTWKASAPVRDKATRAINAATDELKK